MFWLIFGIHLALCVVLVGLVLLQQGKGADMGPAFGSGASNTLFGVGGATPMIVKVTTAVCVLFMVTSVLLIKQFGEHTRSSAGGSDLTTGSVLDKSVLDTSAPNTSAIPEGQPVAPNSSPVAAAVPQPLQSDAVNVIPDQAAASQPKTGGSEPDSSQQSAGGNVP